MVEERSQNLSLAAMFLSFAKKDAIAQNRGSQSTHGRCFLKSASLVHQHLADKFWRVQYRNDAWSKMEGSNIPELLANPLQEFKSFLAKSKNIPH